ncbi:peptide chain release factor N(5)-glutamine methyltransferase [Gulosibacter sp. ACHW.36C]|uniref:peptide chain release factor N(5)-glutamine methyltransferase n=1 Tax=Gulosibacter sediminis TaxID=1729695 RepID=A0ABY4N2P8_9MICO|nr:peptide chain release factor N(5)-glutamine methyltransferase [Gulosibacter sediminis]UQN15911.1 peptide chain release factor N(5)-glutamine methyltransferase [Gulosibacter sediminis]
MDELLASVARRLTRSQLTARDAALLVAAGLGRSLGDVELARLLGKCVDASEAQRILSLAERRARREPLQHLVGSAPFLELELAVGPGVFVPRPETEVLVERAAEELEGAPAGPVADLGSGSGAIAIALALRVPERAVYAFEASPYTWPWLRRNIVALAPGIAPRFGDWRASLDRIDGDFAALVSNPPYVPAREIPRDPEVRLFDPETALFSGSDGLDEIRRIAEVAAVRLRPGGFVAVEHTEDQGAAIRQLFETRGLVDAHTIQDLAERDRHTFARRPD